MNGYHHRLRILAIDPTSKGFGFAVLEGTDRLVDWGFARVWATSTMEFVARVDGMVTRYRPRLLVLPEIPSEPRRARSARRLTALSVHAKHLGIQVVTTTQDEVRIMFPGTKHQRAEAIAASYPSLKPWMPPLRRPWMTEDERIHIFEATAIALSGIGRIP